MLPEPSDNQAPSYLRAIFDTIPLPTFVVDESLEILDFNEASARLLGPNPSWALLQTTGDAFHCIHAVAAGCRKAEPCHNCIIRKSVKEAIRGGKTYRRMHKAQLRTGDKVKTVDLLVSATPLTASIPPRVLLILEDVTELLSLRGLIPICAGCKRIRDDQQYWHNVDAYLRTHMHATLTHGLCPSCLSEQMIRVDPSLLNPAERG